MKPRSSAYMKKKKSNRGRKAIDPDKKKIRIYAGYKSPDDIKKLGGIEKVTALLSNAFDYAVIKERSKI